MHMDRAFIPLPGGCLISESSSSQKAQKCSSDLIVVLVASRACRGVFMLSSIMVLLFIRDWRACLSSPLNMSSAASSLCGSHQPH